MHESPDGRDGDHDPERIARQSEEIKSNWQRTLHDMQAMARDREDEGFDTVAIPAGDTAPEPPEAGDTDRYGLSHVIPDNYTEDFLDLYEGGEFEETGVYQLTSGGDVFMVTECIDMGGRAVIYIAGAFEMRHAPPLVRHATSKGKMYTHVQTLDTTHLGTFEHDDVSAFFPDPEAYYAYEYSP